MNLFDIEIRDLPCGVCGPTCSGIPITTAHHFARKVRGMFGHPLELLHEWPHLGPVPGNVDRADDNKSRAHVQFYRKFPRIRRSYERFATVMGLELLGPDVPFYIQRIPTVRFHFPGSRAVGEAHRDLAYGHQPGELTCWLPLTDCWNSSTIWIEAVEQEAIDHPFARSTDRAPMCAVPMRVGQVLCFDSVNLLHANLLNHEGQEPVMGEHPIYGTPAVTGYEGRGLTRVSFDFRILPCHLHDPETRRTSINTESPMILGGYWTEPLRGCMVPNRVGLPG